MTALHPSRIREAANADPEFTLAARFWDGRVRFDVGGEPYLLAVDGGRISSFEQEEGEAPIRISAPAAEWDELLKPVPRPFYQDLMAAASRQGFTIEGEENGFRPYYPAIRRLIDIMRDLAREA